MSLQKTQHELFRQFFEKPTRGFLKEIFNDNIGERDYLDFKAEWPQLEQVSKHVLALANSGGGAIIFGVAEDSDGEFDNKGLERLVDMADLSKTLKKFIPSQVKYDVFNFVYDESEPKLVGKKFQVLLVEYSEKLLPVLCLKEGNGLKSSVVYVRDGTQSIVANREQLELLINARIDTEYSSTPTLELGYHLEQLKTLCEQVNVLEQEEIFDSNHGLREFLDFEGDKIYSSFLYEMIEHKKQIVKKMLQ
ncbi:helix-turn-helix domain-containing protein [Vibrio coralliilyticus]|uniref:AlbA family DNA-binding domain-containing protein n=1 Tax=Vibrio coralliilyticus TaxID=190893 RepID=UPI001DB75D93|nr:ATP-binding protein [Vibrio coralliilyticus]EHR0803127.1 ATP-binding protein [Vibrio parahaemolyticus]WFB46954.1 ATP-binding protein [Vibrio coralliilyticus]